MHMGRVGRMCFIIWNIGRIKSGAYGQEILLDRGVLVFCFESQE